MTATVLTDQLHSQEAQASAREAVARQLAGQDDPDSAIERELPIAGAASNDETAFLVEWQLPKPGLRSQPRGTAPPGTTRAMAVRRPTFLGLGGAWRTTSRRGAR